MNTDLKTGEQVSLKFTSYNLLTNAIVLVHAKFSMISNIANLDSIFGHYRLKSNHSNVPMIAKRTV